jgi:hypothetical protein
MVETEQQTEPNFTSLGAVFAFEHQTYGAEHLKRVLAAMVEAGETRREFVQRAATELKVLNHSAADMVRDAAAQCPSMVNPDAFCSYVRQPPPISPQANEANVRMWVWSQERRAKAKREQCEALLEQAGIATDWLNGPNRQ